MRVAAAALMAIALSASAANAEAAPKTWVMAEIQEPANAGPAFVEEEQMPLPAVGASFGPGPGPAVGAMPRFAQQIPTPASGPYGQYGYPYSAFPPIPPPMPTYLPPPPYTPQPMVGGQFSNGQMQQQQQQMTEKH